MRRKVSPSPLSNAHRAPRPLAPFAASGRSGTALPKAAAIAFALAAVGCSSPLPLANEAIAPDPAGSAKPAPAPSPTPAASTSATPPIEPVPHEIEGGISLVKPIPSLPKPPSTPGTGVAAEGPSPRRPS